MEHNGKTLLLFTSTFPYGDGEQFIETEILFLARTFSRVCIYPLNADGKARPVPENVEVLSHKLYQPYNRPVLLLKSFRKIWSVFRMEIRLSKHREKYKKRFKYHLDYLLHRFNDAGWLAEELQKYDRKNMVLYSYWFNHWAMLLSIVRFTGRCASFFTRIHGGDYDENRKKAGYFPFRYFEMQQVSAIYPVSEFACRSIRRDYPEYTGILRVSRLGVNDCGNNPAEEQTHFHIVSCSFMIPLKRIHLIIETLARLGFPVRWTHFGDGKLRDALLEKAKQLPSNIEWEFRGHVDNSVVLDHYRTERVDLFMNVSELEGIPVSIMEAISFCIPATGCRICGVPEIVTEQTGLLLEKDFDPAHAAAWISQYRNLPAAEKEVFRKNVKEFWKMNFNAELNYNSFMCEIAGT